MDSISFGCAVCFIDFRFDVLFGGISSFFLFPSTQLLI